MPDAETAELRELDEQIAALRTANGRRPAGARGAQFARLRARRDALAREITRREPERAP